MRVELVWRPQAREDAIQIFRVIAEDSVAAADRMNARLEARAEMLRVFPRAGRFRREIGEQVRAVVEGPYLLLYRLRPQTLRRRGDLTVEIVRVVDGRRELSRFQLQGADV